MFKEFVESNKKMLKEKWEECKNKDMHDFYLEVVLPLFQKEYGYDPVDDENELKAIGEYFKLPDCWIELVENTDLANLSLVVKCTDGTKFEWNMQMLYDPFVWYLQEILEEE